MVRAIVEKVICWIDLVFTVGGRRVCCGGCRQGRLGLECGGGLSRGDDDETGWVRDWD